MVKYLEVERLDDGRIVISGLYLGDKRKGKGWAKIVKDIDATKDNGYAFVGDWVEEGSFVKEGDIIALCHADGSWKYPHSSLYLYRISSEGVEQLGSWDFWTKVEKIKAIQEIKQIIDSLRQKEKSKEEEVFEEIKKIANTYGLKMSELKAIIDKFEKNEVEDFVSEGVDASKSLIRNIIYIEED